MVARRFGVYLASLDPVVGSDLSKTRPCVVISPDEMNRHLRTVIVAPLTTTQKPHPSRVSSRFGGRPGQVALDQIRTVDQSRLTKELGTLNPATAAKVVDVVLEMFA